MSFTISNLASFTKFDKLPSVLQEIVASYAGPYSSLKCANKSNYSLVIKSTFMELRKYHNREGSFLGRKLIQGLSNSFPTKEKQTNERLKDVIEKLENIFKKALGPERAHSIVRSGNFQAMEDALSASALCLFFNQLAESNSQETRLSDFLKTIKELPVDEQGIKLRDFLKKEGSSLEIKRFPSRYCNQGLIPPEAFSFFSATPDFVEGMIHAITLDQITIETFFNFAEKINYRVNLQNCLAEASISGNLKSIKYILNYACEKHIPRKELGLGIVIKSFLARPEYERPDMMKTFEILGTLLDSLSADEVKSCLGKWINQLERKSFLDFAIKTNRKNIVILLINEHVIYYPGDNEYYKQILIWADKNDYNDVKDALVIHLRQLGNLQTELERVSENLRHFMIERGLLIGSINSRI